MPVLDDHALAVQSLEVSQAISRCVGWQDFISCLHGHTQHVSRWIEHGRALEVTMLDPVQQLNLMGLHRSSWDSSAVSKTECSRGATHGFVVGAVMSIVLSLLQCFELPHTRDATFTVDPLPARLECCDERAQKRRRRRV